MFKATTGPEPHFGAQLVSVSYQGQSSLNMNCAIKYWLWKNLSFHLILSHLRRKISMRLTRGGATPPLHLKRRSRHLLCRLFSRLLPNSLRNRFDDLLPSLQVGSLRVQPGFQVVRNWVPGRKPASHLSNCKHSEKWVKGQVIVWASCLVSMRRWHDL